MGRKKIIDPRTDHYSLRINKEEREMLTYIYKETGIRPAKLFHTFIRMQYDSLKENK